MFASSARRLEKIIPSTCSEKASVPMRGSRFVGIDSMRKTTVPGAAEDRPEEHDENSDRDGYDERE